MFRRVLAEHEGINLLILDPTMPNIGFQFLESLNAQSTMVSSIVRN